MAFHRKSLGFSLPMKHSETLGTGWNRRKPIGTGWNGVKQEFGFILFQLGFIWNALKRDFCFRNRFGTDFVSETVS
jgi:hypothetical protein